MTNQYVWSWYVCTPSKQWKLWGLCYRVYFPLSQRALESFSNIVIFVVFLQLYKQIIEEATCLQWAAKQLMVPPIAGKQMFKTTAFLLVASSITQLSAIFVPTFKLNSLFSSTSASAPPPPNNIRYHHAGKLPILEQIPQILPAIEKVSTKHPWMLASN